MNLSEKRQDAAHTLAVPYDATPDMVNQAYNRRLRQRFGLQNTERDIYIRSIENLYDARVRMKTPMDRQWRAQLRLMATSGVDKMLYALMSMVMMLSRDGTSVTNQMLVNDLMTDIPKMRRKYNILRGVYAYELGGLLGMMVYDQVKTQHNPIIPLVVYGSMLCGGFAIGLLQDSIDRDMIKISAWSKILSFDKFFNKEK